MSSTGTAIEVQPKFNILQFILFIFPPTVAVDGNSQKVSWNRPTRVDVSAGSHTVEVWFRYLFLAKAGKNSIQVTVPEGQTARVAYKAPWIVFMKGKLKAE